LYKGSLAKTAKDIGLELKGMTERCKRNYDMYVEAQKEFNEIMVCIKKIMGKDWKLVPCNPNFQPFSSISNGNSLNISPSS